jgi:alanine racemase
MDQLTVLLPEDHGRPGDEVVFFGEARTEPGGAPLSGGGSGAPERILCEEVARLLGTINYEIVCDVSPRVVRRYRGAAPTA